MPEGLEAELYRRSAEACVGRRVASVAIDHRQPMAHEIVSALPGCSFGAARRHGKLVMLETHDTGGHDGPTLGLHFGMTGRLIVDDDAAIDRLEYASGRDEPKWDRLDIVFDDGGRLRVNDPRRWARFVLDPDESRLGPDFLTVDAEHLAERFARRRVALKTVLLDQSVVAGFGNFCVDEILWQAGLSPLRPARSLGPDEIESVVRTARRHLPAMLRRGGSHRGTIDPEVRAALPACPRDGVPMRRDTVGGRTTIWCPAHQPMTQ
jgi:formamidopyrimidine-DNA glycosylase